MRWPKPTWLSWSPLNLLVTRLSRDLGWSYEPKQVPSIGFEMFWPTATQRKMLTIRNTSSSQQDSIRTCQCSLTFVAPGSRWNLWNARGLDIAFMVELWHGCMLRLKQPIFLTIWPLAIFWRLYIVVGWSIRHETLADWLYLQVGTWDYCFLRHRLWPAAQLKDVWLVLSRGTQLCHWYGGKDGKVHFWRIVSSFS